jgi:hypothetical protein
MNKHPLAKQYHFGAIAADIIRINGESYGLRIALDETDNLESIIIDTCESDPTQAIYTACHWLNGLIQELRLDALDLNKRIAKFEKSHAKKKAKP